MGRNRIFQVPVVEDFTCKFYDCKIFSKMNLKQSYHQLVLHQDVRNVAILSTPWGNMRPKWLIFGAKASQNLFDEAMFRIFGDIPYCLTPKQVVSQWQIIIKKSRQFYNEQIVSVLHSAKRNVYLGFMNLSFMATDLPMSDLNQTQEKVRAVKKSKSESKDDVKSFLGMIGYLSKLIPYYAVLTAPSRRHTWEDVPFSWGPEEDKVFQRLKNSITNYDTMAFSIQGNTSLFAPRIAFMKNYQQDCFKDHLRDYNLFTTLAGQWLLKKMIKSNREDALENRRNGWN